MRKVFFHDTRHHTKILFNDVGGYLRLSADETYDVKIYPDRLILTTPNQTTTIKSQITDKYSLSIRDFIRMRYVPHIKVDENNYVEMSKLISNEELSFIFDKELFIDKVNRLEKLYG